MTTTKKNETNRKGGNSRKNETISAASAAGVVRSARRAASAGSAGAAASAASHDVAVAVRAGAAAPAPVASGRASAVACMLDSDIKVLELRTRIASRWAAPEWSGAADLRAKLEALGLDESAVSAAIRKQAISEGFTFDAVCPSVAEVVEYIHSDFAKEFRQVCGCAVPAASAVRVYSYTGLSVSTITADSNINDYISAASVPAGASASAVVAAVLSVRVLADVKRRISAAAAAARSDMYEAAAGVCRMAQRLGVDVDTLCRYMRLKMQAVSVADDKEIKRLRGNLSRCWASLRAIENEIVLAAPAGAYGAIEDLEGGWCFPADLPASAPAKVRKLWARRVRQLSAITTLNGLLSAAGAA